MDPVPVVASGLTTVKRLKAWNFAENGGDVGAEARVLLRDGAAGGDIFVDIRLAAKQSVGEQYDDPMIFPAGCYVEVNAGAVRGSVSEGG